MNNLIILNNSFSNRTEIDFRYLFWGYNKFFKVCCNEPFIKGDVAKIANINSNEIDIELVKNTKDVDKLPLLVFLKSRIPHKLNSKYFPVSEKTDDFEVLQKQQIIMEQNKFYIYSLLVYNNCVFSTQDVLYKHRDNFNIVINRNNTKQSTTNISNADLAK
jgi:hypothetical protein